MYEIDFLPVGDGARSGDAIAMRFTRPDNGRPAHVVIEAAFKLTARRSSNMSSVITRPIQLTLPLSLTPMVITSAGLGPLSAS